jgi:cytoskeletal protein RodZ
MHTPHHLLLYAIAALAFLYMACARPALGALLVIVCFFLLYVRPAARTATTSTPSSNVAARHSASTSKAATHSDEPSTGAVSTEETAIAAVRGGTQQHASTTTTTTEEDAHVTRQHVQQDYLARARFLDSLEDDLNLPNDMYTSIS